MQIITLTSDSGTKDHYVASMKGAIVSLFSSALIIDVSHEIRPFDIAEAAHQLRNCFDDFPIGTVHIIGVDAEPQITPGSDEGSYPSILKYKGQYIVANDNGFFGAFLDQNHPEEFYRVEKLVEDIPLTDSAIVKELITLDCILPNVALAQIKTESDHYKSTITKDNKNIAGIKTSNSKYVTGMKHEHCTYATYRDCLRDYVRIQNRYLKNIDGRYAMSTNYISTLKQIR
jgi:hypothetical protein